MPGSDGRSPAHRGKIRDHKERQGGRRTRAALRIAAEDSGSTEGAAFHNRRYHFSARHRVGCAEVILLDTHAAVWILRDDAALGKKARSQAARALDDGELAISAISFWEIALLIARRRLRALDDPSETRRLMIQAGIREIPLTG